MIKQRRLVGRRFEDYLRNGIHIELTPEERLFRMYFSDPRYASQLDRRRFVRRAADAPPELAPDFFQPACAICHLHRILGPDIDLIFFE